MVKNKKIITSLRNNGIEIEAIHVCVNACVFPDSNLNRLISRYYNEQKWGNTVSKLFLDNVKENLDILKDFTSDSLASIKPELLEQFYTHFYNGTLFKYISMNPHIDYRGRLETYKGQDVYYNYFDTSPSESDSDINKKKEYPNNLLYIFNIEKYKELGHVDEIDYEYVFSSLKILLFIKLVDALKDKIGEYEVEEEKISFEYLAEKALYKIENAIITGVELSDTLFSGKYFYEDYFYELSQLNLNDKNNYCISNLNRQNLIFRIENEKIYPSNYTEEEKESNKLKRTLRKRDKLDREFHALAEEELAEYESIYGDTEGYHSGSFYDDYDDEEIYETSPLNFKHSKDPKRRVDVSVKFRRIPLYNGTKVFLNIFEANTINKVLGLNEDLEAPPKVNLFPLTSISNIQANFNRYILEKILKSSKEFEENLFDSVKKSTFRCDMNFIKNSIFNKEADKKQNFTIHKIILTLLLNKMSEDDVFKVLSTFKYTQRRELVGFMTDLNKKQQGIKGKAILDIYYYFKTRVESYDR